jgi:hypothetical protein
MERETRRTNLNRVDRERLSVYRVRLDDCHAVSVDGEREVGVARHRDEAHAVALARGDADDGELRGGAARKTSQAVD